MPIYVYECSSCHTTFEAIQSYRDDALTSCACGASGGVKRIIQPIAVMFKGEGFHINDYAAKPAAEAKPAVEAPKTEPVSTPTPEPAKAPEAVSAPESKPE